MAHTIIKNVNPYVESRPGYGADSVKVDLNESTFVVKAFPVDTNGNQVAGSANLVNKTLGNLSAAIKYYDGIVKQLEQGDVIRNV